ncbi:MAG: CDP-diacylglycerol--serine O-phosphatidyltransferase [Myxococcota bacterium]
MSTTGDSVLHHAAWAISLSLLLDTLDGQVARWTGTQSAFGRELDSLADLVSFGAAPALLLYRWALSHLGSFGGLVAFAYVALAAIRLARFNVAVAKFESSRDFEGLPTPVAAAVVVAVVLAHAPDETPSAVHVSMGALGLASLMVSSLRYRRDPRGSMPRTLQLLVVGAMGGLAWLSWRGQPFVGVALVCGLYVVLAPAEAVVTWARGREGTIRSDGPGVETRPKSGGEIAPPSTRTRGSRSSAS